MLQYHTFTQTETEPHILCTCRRCWITFLSSLLKHAYPHSRPSGGGTQLTLPHTLHHPTLIRAPPRSIQPQQMLFRWIAAQGFLYMHAAGVGGGVRSWSALKSFFFPHCTPPLFVRHLSHGPDKLDSGMEVSAEQPCAPISFFKNNGVINFKVLNIDFS